MRALASVVVVVAAVAIGPARAESPAPKPRLPSPAPLKPSPLSPPVLAPGVGGVVVVNEGSLEFLISLAMRLAAGDAAADMHMLAQMLNELNQMKSLQRQLTQHCEAQRAAGKPCDREAELAALNEAIATRQREIDERRRQDAAARLAQLAADLGRIEGELRGVLGSLRDGAQLKADPGKVVTQRAQLTDKVQRTLDQVTARRGEIVTRPQAKPTSDAGAPKTAK